MNSNMLVLHPELAAPRRNDVNPRLEQENLKQTTCDVQRMLAHFVSMVQPDALHGKQTDQSDADFLKPFLEQMTDVANQPAVMSTIQTLCVNFLTCDVFS